jgi:hypothetical protein
MNIKLKLHLIIIYQDRMDESIDLRRARVKEGKERKKKKES